METKRQRLQSLIFEHLDSDLSNTVKKKLGSTGAQEIVTSLVNFIHSHRQEIRDVLLDPTPQAERGQKGSIFEPVEEPGFLSDLSNIEE